MQTDQDLPSACVCGRGGGGSLAPGILSPSTIDVMKNVTCRAAVAQPPRYLDYIHSARSCRKNNININLPVGHEMVRRLVVPTFSIH